MMTVCYNGEGVKAWYVDNFDFGFLVGDKGGGVSCHDVGFGQVVVGCSVKTCR